MWVTNGAAGKIYAFILFALYSILCQCNDRQNVLPVFYVGVYITVLPVFYVGVYMLLVTMHMTTRIALL